MKPKVYALPGLAADHRIYREFTLEHGQMEVIEWERPHRPDMTFRQYAKQLSSRIPPNSRHYLCGVSLGGIIAQEMALISQPVHTFLISSLKRSKPLPFLIEGIRKVRINEWLHWKQVKKVPMAVKPLLDNPVQVELVPNMLEDSDADFSDWAIRRILDRETHPDIENVSVIHGTSDKVFPYGQVEADLTIPKGNHFMVMGHGAEISNWIDQQIMNHEANFRQQ